MIGEVILPLCFLLAAVAVVRHRWLMRVLEPVWNRLHPRKPRPAEHSVEQLAADLRRLAAHLEQVRTTDEPAKMARLTAAAMAYDYVLLSACRTFEIPAPSRAPMEPIERLETEAALASQGLSW